MLIKNLMFKMEEWVKTSLNTYYTKRYRIFRQDYTPDVIVLKKREGEVHL